LPIIAGVMTHELSDPLALFLTITAAGAVLIVFQRIYNKMLDNRHHTGRFFRS